MTYRCQHCQFEFDSFYRLAMHLSATVADSLGDVGPILPAGHPEHVTTVGAHEVSAFRELFAPSKHCEKIGDGGPCPNDAEVFVRWECGVCTLLMCSTCLIEVTHTTQQMRRDGVALFACPGGGEHDLTKFRQPVAI